MRNNVYYLTDPQHFKIKQIELTVPKHEYVTLKYLYCGICGGDYSCYLGRRKNFPLTLGHEFVAMIVYAGKSRKFAVGDIVVSDLNYRCQKCSFCNSGKSHLCIHHADNLFTNRGFAQYGNIHTNYLYPIPKIEWLPRACFIEPLSCVIHACSMLRIQRNSHILIVGGGSIGSMFAFFLTLHYQCSNIEIIDKILQRTKHLNNCFNTQITNGKNGPYDLVIDCSNELEGTILALNATNSGGEICIMSHLYGLNTSLIYEIICKKEIRAHFPLRNGEVSNMNLAIKYITTKWCSNYDQLIHIYDDIEEAFIKKNNAPWNKQIIKIHH